MSWACEVIYKGRLWPLFGDQRKKMVREEVERLSLSELPWLYTCAVYLTKDSEMAEDLVQDTYLEAYRRFNSYEAGANCRVWLLSILRKIFIHRKGKRVVEPEIINWNKLHQDYESLVLPQSLSISQLNDRGLDYRGRENQTRVSSGELSALTWPPWASINSFTMARPIPAPPCCRERDFSPR